MSLYRVPPASAHSAAGQPAVPVACRYCPGGGSRSTRARCYPSDMDEREWAVCEPLLPPPAWLAGQGGRRSAYCMRDIVDGIRYLTHNGRCGGPCPRTSARLDRVLVGLEMAGRRVH